MKHRVLFVDDEVMVLDALRRGLEPQSAHWTLVFCDDPAMALRAMTERSFDVVVGDVKMPGMSGIDMIVAMRRHRPETRYLLLTGSADLSVAVDAVNRGGIFRMLLKPCPIPVLVEAIEQALRPEKGASFGDMALDRLAVGVVVLAPDSRLLYTNRVGGALLQPGGGLHVGPDGICRAIRPVHTRELHALVKGAALGAEGGVLSLEKESGDGVLSVAVCATHGNATLYINDPAQTKVASPDRLRKLLGLSPAEARLAHALASGASLEEAAHETAIQVGTARGYLKQIFGKTATTRQAELVRLVLCQPAIDEGPYSAASPATPGAA